ncbi:MAG: hypothetical protein ACI898_001602 [Flavobacteriales bacterium]|jgi:hypothetical protein
MKHALLVGNDINNINNSESWENLLANIQIFCGVQIENPGYKKPFPLFYEEIFLSAKRSKVKNEFALKQFIAKSIDGIKSNSIHERIRNLAVEDIMTTNYDFTLEGISSPKLTSVMTERKYSIFRQFTSGHQRFWHVHGDTKKPSSITLGFEQYGGQLQTLRNYIATGPIYKNKKIPKTAFSIRFRQNPDQKLFSWSDLFFTNHVHILGLGLDFVESDLWWLLTFRSRLIHQRKIAETNQIYYYTPKSRQETDKAKLDLMIAIGLKLVVVDAPDRRSYYNKVIDLIELNVSNGEV